MAAKTGAVSRGGDKTAPPSSAARRSKPPRKRSGTSGRREKLGGFCASGQIKKAHKNATPRRGRLVSKLRWVGGLGEKVGQPEVLALGYAR